MLSVIIYVNNKKISNDLKLSTWYNASNFTSISDTNMSSWVFSNLSETRYATNASSVFLGRPAFTEYFYFFATKDEPLYANIMAVGSVYGQLLRNQTMSWFPTSQNNLDFDVVVY